MKELREIVQDQVDKEQMNKDVVTAFMVTLLTDRDKPESASIQVLVDDEMMKDNRSADEIRHLITLLDAARETLKGMLDFSMETREVHS